MHSGGSSVYHALVAAVANANTLPLGRWRVWFLTDSLKTSKSPARSGDSRTPAWAHPTVLDGASPGCTTSENDAKPSESMRIAITKLDTPSGTARHR
eukprot:scaffold39105_cov76-Phaeocystis_antarctica.AAC.13